MENKTNYPKQCGGCCYRRTCDYNFEMCCYLVKKDYLSYGQQTKN